MRARTTTARWRWRPEARPFRPISTCRRTRKPARVRSSWSQTGFRRRPCPLLYNRTRGGAHMKRSAGLLLFRRRASAIEFFLVHPGGPFWTKKDEGAWSIPKGLYEGGESPLAAARREFTEETGFTVDGDFVELGAFKQPGGKLVSAWLVEGDCEPRALKSNRFCIEWPPRSGRTAEFPEIDRAGWFAPGEAARKIHRGQKPIIALAAERLRGQGAATQREDWRH